MRGLTAEQQEAFQRTVERMKRGVDLGGAKFNRDELYED
jgi:hypothetical protein